MVYFVSSFVFVFSLLASVLISEFAVSGCGNPVSANTVDSNNDIGYVYEEQNVTVNYLEQWLLQQKHRIRWSKIKGKYAEYL